MSQTRGNYLPPSSWDAEAVSPLPTATGAGVRARYAKMAHEEHVALAKKAVRARESKRRAAAR